MEFEERQIHLDIYIEECLRLKKSTANYLEDEVYFALVACHLAGEAGSIVQGLQGSRILAEVNELRTDIDIARFDIFSIRDDIESLYISQSKQWIERGFHDLTLDLASFFLDRLLEIKYGLDYLQPKAAAAFVHNLAPVNSGYLIDKIPLAAELVSKSSRYSGVLLSRTKDKIIGRVLSLKVLLKGELPKFDYFKKYSSVGTEGGTFVFDSPSTVRRENEVPSAPQVFESFIEKNEISGRFVVITPVSKDHAADVSNIVLPLIGRKLHLEAVVSFGTRQRDGKIKTYQALVLSRGLPGTRYPTLYIDVSGNNPSLMELASEECSSLAACIINLQQGKQNHEGLITDRVSTILNAQFSAGYCDVKMLCGQVINDPSKKLKIESVKQVLSKKSSSSSDVNFSADAREILERIQGSSSVACTYVIGSNGAGKSFMLHDLTHRMIKLGIRVVGMSTGVYDRFPVGVPSAQFLYQGMKGKSGAINVSRLSQLVTKLAAKIFQHQNMLNVFTECLRVLGYEARYYFMRRPEAHLSTAPSRIRHRVLGPIVKDNGIPTDIRNFEFGVVRADDREKVTPVSSLSSGEQNINYLLMGMICSAKKGAVFLIDEPEISLHLQWQLALPKVFDIVAKSFGISIVVATHSPTLIANANESSDFSYVLSKGKLRLLSDEERYSVESIILEGFDTYTPNNRAVHERCAQLVAQSMADEEEVSVQESIALKQLSGIKNKVLKRFDKQRIPGAEQDLDLIDKACAAIEMLLADRQKLSDAKEGGRSDG
ncbi:ATP-binding protein [Pantoea sp. Ap-967]|uniref:AAA family ATPase n=1 Tax=Pantoea sp. Ap-967 TaxID=2608362 RepID=UPI0014221BFF|nr:AAA family ATPase [Pantoea sp. Ap-967]NIE77101.1 ATP-binding protein [Pantoea sp. Ap-967]